MKSILLPYDSSPSSVTALSIGASIAGLADVQFLGLFVEDTRRLTRVEPITAAAGGVGIQPIVESPLPPKELLAESEKIEAETAALREQFYEECSRARVRGEFHDERGTPTEVIAEYADCVDLVITGNSGKHSGVNYLSEGYTTNALLHHTATPVLVVPEEALGTNTILCAYDGSYASRRTLRVAAMLAELTDVEEFHLLTVDRHRSDADKTQSVALRYLTPYDFKVRSIYSDGNVHDAILERAESVDTSIIALGAFGQNRLRDRIFGNTTTKILERSSRAVLVSP